MAEFNVELPRLENGEPDLDIWLDHACQRAPESRKAAMAVFDLVPPGESRQQGLQLVELLLQLKMDVVTLMAGMCYFAIRREEISENALPAEVARLVAAISRLSSVNVLAFTDAALLSSESKTQANNVRHVLVALIDDPRVAVVKLAERVVTLRHARDGDRAARLTMAREASEFFAPLANRLGIWQLKWLLEDLAFRYQHPKEFQQIVAKLDGRREARERQVEAIRQDMEFRLSSEGIDAEVQGRAKHIFSIWKKMNHKSIDFSQVYDVQAVRVLVDRIDACYRVLGVVHTSWPSIPSEFDDYIANPKENGYRSIHTTVIGPFGATLEVQIRTREMHEEAELGLCAHWAYKTELDGKPNKQADALRSQKMDWLRSVLEWHDQQRPSPALATATTASNRVGDTADNAPSNAFSNSPIFGTQERIYVTTPQGHVLDLAPNATAVDFAYRIHTEIGHRCQGARVEGRSVALNRRLATGECVEIETGEKAEPQREWLNPALGFVNTARARAKIQSWFRGQPPQTNIDAGRALLKEALASSPVVLEDLARMAGYPSENEMLLAIGIGDQVVADLIKLVAAPDADESAKETENRRQESDVSNGKPVTLIVRGRDRDGLLRDVMVVVAASSLQAVAATARADVPGKNATISLELHVADPAQLLRAMKGISGIADVVDVQRQGS